MTTKVEVKDQFISMVHSLIHHKETSLNGKMVYCFYGILPIDKYYSYYNDINNTKNKIYISGHNVMIT